MAATINWPDELPGPLLNFQDSAVPYETRTPMTEGPDRIRRKSQTIPKAFSIAFHMTAQQFYLFVYFHEVVLDGGVEFFNLEIDDNAGAILTTKNRVVRFSEPFHFRTISHNRYLVSIKLESYEDDPIDANIVGRPDLMPVLASIAAKTADVGVALSITLPAATGGNTPLTYSIAGLPTGLSFNASTRVVSGTPTTADSFSVVYTVTDDDGDSAERTFAWVTSVVDLMPALAAIAAKTGTVGTAINITLPAATGGNTPLTYSIADLPTGLSFNASTRVVSGTPTTADSFSVVYTVTDDDGDSAERTFNWVIAAAQTSIFASLAALTGVNLQNIAAGAYVVDFTASSMPQDYWEHTPSEGTLHQNFPTDMFTNTGIFWIERFRVQSNGTSLNIHRGGSNVLMSSFEGTWTDDWAWYIYSMDTGEYLILQANDQNTVGGGFITYSFSNWTIVAQSTGSMTSAEWLNSLAGERVIVALTPTNTYRP